MSVIGVVPGSGRPSTDTLAPVGDEMISIAGGALELSLPKVPWEPSDRKLSEAMTSYWANFARTGDPNGNGLPKWPRFDQTARVLHLDETITDQPEANRARYEALDAYAWKQDK